MGQNNKEKTDKEIALEMLPYALYAAIPIFIVICIAYTFGVK